jgi:hypothetical protein
MNAEEVEYQCSECRTSVRADAKVCPRCGASLEDEPIDVELERIPISSNPVDVAVVESLLKENDVEYSIHRDSLNSLFGLSLEHPAILMVRRDQAGIAKQILSNYRTETDMPESQPAQQHSLKGVKGWLLFVCVGWTVMGPAMSLPSFIDYFTTTRNRLWDSTLLTVNDIQTVLAIVVLLYGIYAGIQLWRVQPGALRTANTFLNVFLVYAVLTFLMGIYVFSVLDLEGTRSVVPGFIKQAMQSFGFVVLSKWYFRHSERVKNTYHS